MLQIKLNNTKTINEEGTRIILSDGTGMLGDTHYEQDPDNVGEYILVTNDTGYGEGNGNRLDYAYFIVGKKLGVTVDKLISFDPYSPMSSSSWQAITEGDGVYKFWIIFAQPVLSPEPINFVEGQVIYDVVENKLVKLVDGVFEVVTPESLVNTQYSSSSIEFPHLVYSGTLFTELVAKRVDLMIRCCSEKDVTLCTKAIDDIEAGIYSMNYEYCKGNKLNAIAIADYLNNKDYTNVLKL